MRITPIHVLVAVVCVSCSDTISDRGSDPWTLGEDGPDDSSPSNNHMPGVSNNGSPNNVTPDSLPTCVEPQTSTHRIDGAPAISYPVVVDDRVFLTFQSVDTMDAAILEWGEREIQQVADTDRDGGLFAGAGHSIWHTRDGLLSRIDLGDGSEQQFDVRPGLSYPNLSYFAAPRRQVTDTRVAWLQDGVVMDWHEGVLEERGDGVYVPPWLSADALAWADASDSAGGVVHVAHVEGTLEVRGDEDEAVSWPVIARQRVFYLRGGAVWAASLDGTSDVAVLDEAGSCGAPYTDGSTVVTACNPNPPSDMPTGGDYLAVGARDVWTIDARTLATAVFPGESGKVVYAPIVTRRWLAWVSFEPGFGGPDTFGEIIVQPRGGDPSAAKVIATMGAGCPYCNSYWPAPRLDISGDTLVWNYAIDSQSVPGMLGRDQIGIARLRECSDAP